MVARRSGLLSLKAIEIDQEAIIACGQQIVAIEDFESLKGQVTNGSSMDRLEHLKLELEFEFEFKFKWSLFLEMWDSIAYK